MKRQAYLDLKDRQRKEVEDFPIAYAFNDEQLKEALKKLGVEDTKECVSVFGHGDIVKKENAPKLVAMLKRHTNEVKEALKDPDFAQAAFLYEMDNHEYAINWDFIRENGLQLAYESARNKHYKNMEDWGVI